MRTIEQIRDVFSEHDYIMLGEYIGSKKPCVCCCKKCGHVTGVALHHVEKVNCKNCKHQEVIDLFNYAGCKLLEPPKLTGIMSYVCSCGNVSKITWHHFKNGGRCRKCGYQKSRKNNGRRLLTKQKINDIFEKNNCKLLDMEYVNQSTKMKFLCSCGKESEITLKQFRRGGRCHDCAKRKIENRFMPHGKYHSNWNPNRDVVLLNKKIREKAKSSLKRSLRAIRKAKTEKTFDSLGYSRNELESHILNHPNWMAVKNSKWELDHYFPIKAFVDCGIYDEKIINSLDNLRPIEKKLNRQKNDSYDFFEFKGWLVNKGVSCSITVP